MQKTAKQKRIACQAQVFRTVRSTQHGGNNQGGLPDLDNQSGQSAGCHIIDDMPLFAQATAKEQEKHGCHNGEKGSKIHGLLSVSFVLSS